MDINRLAVEELTERYELWQRDYKDQMPQYGAVLSAAIAALKKQIPAVPIKSMNPAGREYWFCPQCGAITAKVGEEELLTDYCPACGQALGWEREDA